MDGVTELCIFMTKNYKIVNFWKNVLDSQNFTKLIIKEEDWLVLSLCSNSKSYTGIEKDCVERAFSTHASANVITLETTKLTNYSLVRFMICLVHNFFLQDQQIFQFWF